MPKHEGNPKQDQKVKTTLFREKSDAKLLTMIKRQLKYHQVEKEKHAPAPSSIPLHTLPSTIVKINSFKEKSEKKWTAPAHTFSLSKEYMIKILMLDKILSIKELAKIPKLKKMHETITPVLTIAKEYKDQFETLNRHIREYEYFRNRDERLATLKAEYAEKTSEEKKDNNLKTQGPVSQEELDYLKNQIEQLELHKRTYEQNKLDYGVLIANINSKKEFVEQSHQTLTALSKELNPSQERDLYHVLQQMNDPGFNFLDILPKNIIELTKLYNEVSLMNEAEENQSYLANGALFRCIPVSRQIKIILTTSSSEMIYDLLEKMRIPRLEFMSEFSKIAETFDLDFNPRQILYSNPRFHIDYTKYLLSTKPDKALYEILNDPQFFIAQGGINELGIHLKDFLQSDVTLLKTFFQHRGREGYAHNLYFSNLEKIDLLANTSFHFKNISEFKQFLKKVNIDLYRIGASDPAVRQRILTSEYLSASLSPYQLNSLRELTLNNKDEKIVLPSMRHIQFYQSADNIRNDVIEILTELKRLFVENNKILLSIKDPSKEIQMIQTEIEYNKSELEYFKERDESKSVKRYQDLLQQNQSELKALKQKVSAQDNKIIQSLSKKYNNYLGMVENALEHLQKVNRPEDIIGITIEIANALKQAILSESKNETKHSFFSRLSSSLFSIANSIKSLIEAKEVNLLKISHDYIPGLLKTLYKIAEFLPSYQTEMKDEKKEIIPYEAKYFWHIREPFLTPPSSQAINPPVPKLIHYHWHGGPLPHKYFRNIMNTCAKADDHQVILWADNPKSVLKAVRNHKIEPTDHDKHDDWRFLDGIEAEEAFRRRVHVVDLQYLLQETKKLMTPAAFNLVIKILTEEGGGLRNLAYFTDLTRLLSLLVMGGIYLDTDVLSTDQFILNQQHYGFLHGDNNNNVLLATPNHPIIRGAIVDLLDNYQFMQRTRGILAKDQLSYLKRKGKEPDRKAFTYSHSLHDFKRLPTEPTSMPFPLTRRDLSIELGGPGGLNRSINQYCESENFEASSFTFKSQHQRVSRELSPLHAGEQQTRSDFGGIFPVCDETWLDNEQKDRELQDKAPEPKNKKPKAFDI